MKERPYGFECIDAVIVPVSLVSLVCFAAWVTLGGGYRTTVAGNRGGRRFGERIRIPSTLPVSLKLFLRIKSRLPPTLVFMDDDDDDTDILSFGGGGGTFGEGAIGDGGFHIGC